MKRALITGITGQDGSYLAELLLEKGYEVYGIIRRSSSFNTGRLERIYKDPHEPNLKLRLMYGDLNDASSLNQILRTVKPDEVYHLAAQSHVRVSFDIPEYTAEVTAMGTLRLLEAIREARLQPRFYFAGSSEMFGKAQEVPQRETTPFYPRSPYACAKVFAFHFVRNYREAYGLFACNGILFNHESPRRGETFVSRKITRAATRIKLGLQDVLYLGNFDAKRDWGYAPEYCLDEETEILTNDGFKSYHDIRVGNVILNFNMETNRVEKDLILKKHLFDYNGKMLVFEGRGVKIQCTPEHRIIFQFKSKQSKGGWSAWKVCTAKEFAERLKDKARRTKYDYRLPGLQGYESEPINIRGEELKLIGYLAAEGNLKASQGHGRGLAISVSQSWKANPGYYREIKQSIHRLGLGYHERKRQNGCSEFLFDAASTRRLLDLYDGFDIHRLPSWVMRGSARQLNTVLTTMMNGDGTGGTMTYVSASLGLMSNFQTLATKLGYRTLVHQRRSGIHECTLVSKRKIYAYVTDIHEVPYRGKVWCVTTKNGSMIIRKDHRVSVVGNCEAMWLMLQQEEPDDYVIATGEAHSVREFVEEAFGCLGLDWQRYVKIDSRYLRPTEVDALVGDASKAHQKLGWKPTVTFKELVRLMVDADLELAEREAHAKTYVAKNSSVLVR